ncbi:hypothetical protein KR009_005002 [Drosophila setifemur]|nr:hypothetical protein KR009_005002 [Drosophila setifemur]
MTLDGCLTCELLRWLWCWVKDLSCQLQDSDTLKLIMAIGVSMLILFNVYAGYYMCAEPSYDEEPAANPNEEDGQTSGDESGEGSVVTAEDAGNVSDPTRSREIVRCSAQRSPDSYDYGFVRGPHTWTAPGNNQSPINIETSCLKDNCFDTPLVWSKYNDLPLGIRLENNGHTLVVRASFPCGSPWIDGGDLLGRFVFREISFRWSWCNSSGSEHTVRNLHYPLEMQCLHEDSQQEGCTSSQGILMISYVFDLSQDNPFLDVLIQHLAAVQCAGQAVEVPPFPLSYLMPAFYTRFFSYLGSLTEPPCHRGAEWFLYPEPLAISERQLNEFRQLRDTRGARITRNARPVQPLEDRTVYFNRYRTGG